MFLALLLCKVHAVQHSTWWHRSKNLTSPQRKALEDWRSQPPPPTPGGCALQQSLAVLRSCSSRCLGMSSSSTSHGAVYMKHLNTQWHGIVLYVERNVVEDPAQHVKRAGYNACINNACNSCATACVSQLCGHPSHPTYIILFRSCCILPSPGCCNNLVENRPGLSQCIAFDDRSKHSKSRSERNTVNRRLVREILLFRGPVLIQWFIEVLSPRLWPTFG